MPAADLGRRWQRMRRSGAGKSAPELSDTAWADVRYA